MNEVLNSKLVMLLASDHVLQDLKEYVSHLKEQWDSMYLNEIGCQYAFQMKKS